MGKGKRTKGSRAEVPVEQRDVDRVGARVGAAGFEAEVSSLFRTVLAGLTGEYVGHYTEGAITVLPSIEYAMPYECCRGAEADGFGVVAEVKVSRYISKERLMAGLVAAERAVANIPADAAHKGCEVAASIMSADFECHFRFSRHGVAFLASESPSIPIMEVYTTEEFHTFVFWEAVA